MLVLLGTNELKILFYQKLSNFQPNDLSLCLPSFLCVLSAVCLKTAFVLYSFPPKFFTLFRLSLTSLRYLLLAIHLCSFLPLCFSSFCSTSFTLLMFKFHNLPLVKFALCTVVQLTLCICSHPFSVSTAFPLHTFAIHFLFTFSPCAISLFAFFHYCTCLTFYLYIFLLLFLLCYLTFSVFVF